MTELTADCDAQTWNRHEALQYPTHAGSFNGADAFHQCVSSFLVSADGGEDGAPLPRRLCLRVDGMCAVLSNDAAGRLRLCARAEHPTAAARTISCARGTDDRGISLSTDSLRRECGPRSIGSSGSVA